MYQHFQVSTPPICSISHPNANLRSTSLFNIGSHQYGCERTIIITCGLFEALPSPQQEPILFAPTLMRYILLSKIVSP